VQERWEYVQVTPAGFLTNELWSLLNPKVRETESHIRAHSDGNLILRTPQVSVSEGSWQSASRHSYMQAHTMTHVVPGISAMLLR
jgi:hypothetical protein